MSAPIFGIDVNYPVDWRLAKGSGVQFGWIKASQGTWFKTSHYKNNIAGLVGEGLEPGAYHFLEGGDGAGQAEVFYSIVGEAYGTRWLDVEWSTCNRQTVIDFNTRWAQLTKRRLGDYTGRDFWRNLTGNLDVHADHPLWVAGYRANLYVPGTGTLAQQWAKVGGNNGGLPFSGWSTAAAMQFSDHTVVNGANQLTDGDIWLGDLASLQAMAGATVVETAATAVGEDMHLFKNSSGIYDLSGGWRTHVFGDVVTAYAASHPEQFDAHGNLPVISDAGLANFPERPAWMLSPNAPAGTAVVDVPALTTALVSALTPLVGGTDPSQIGKALAADLAARLQA